jgi:hypothetical protein
VSCRCLFPRVVSCLIPPSHTSGASKEEGANYTSDPRPPTRKKRLAADFVRCRGELPEPLAGVDGRVLHAAGVLAAVQEAKVVGAGGLEGEVGCEEGGVEGLGRVVEEGGLRAGLDCSR